MIDAILLGFEWTWDPGFRGILTVVLSVAVLCGGSALILATNSGARLGFQIGLTALMGWLFVMGIIWSLYGIGWRGESPTWNVVDVVASEPDSGVVDSRIDLATQLPLPSELPDPVELRDADEELLAAYPVEQRDPTLPDLVTVDTELKEELDEAAGDWRILEASNKYTGETQAVVTEALGTEGQGLFDGAEDYIVVQSFLTGGKPVNTDDSTIGRIREKIRSTLNYNPPDFYAAVQLQPVIPQEPKPGEAPPAPVADPTQPVYTVVLERVNGHMQRRPQLAFTLVTGVSTAFLCSSLHRRDKLALAQRAAVAGAS